MPAAIACLALMPCWAFAQDIGDRERAAVRALVEQGDEAWDARDYETAYDLFRRARGIVNAPTIAVRQAECLEKLGRLVEASELYLATSRIRLEPGASEPFRRAVAVAFERAEALRGRHATLKLTISGEDLDGAQVLIDGREIPSVLIGTAFPVDPGSRLIEVVKGKRKASRTVRIAEKGSATVVIDLPPAEPEPGDAAPPVAGSSQPKDKPESTRPYVLETSSQPTWGWVMFGIGVGGVALGGVTGGLAIKYRGDLDDAVYDDGNPVCSGTTCTDKKSTVNNYNTMRTVSTVGFGVGIVGLATGLTLLLTAPEPKLREVAGVRPWVGFGSVGVEGKF